MIRFSPMRAGGEVGEIFYIIILYGMTHSSIVCRHCLYVHHWRAATGEGLPAKAPRYPRQCFHSILLLCRHHYLHLGGNSKLI